MGRPRNPRVGKANNNVPQGLDLQDLVTAWLCLVIRVRLPWRYRPMKGAAHEILFTLCQRAKPQSSALRPPCDCSSKNQCDLVQFGAQGCNPVQAGAIRGSEENGKRPDFHSLTAAAGVVGVKNLSDMVRFGRV